MKARIRFTTACLGSVKTDTAGKWPIFMLPRGADGSVRFEQLWWRAGLRFAAQLMSRHQDVVNKVLADAKVHSDRNVESYYRRKLSEDRYIKHECFPAGMTVEIRFAVPSEIPNEEFKQLLNKMGQFRGITPFGPKEYGHFVVEELGPCEDGNASEDP